jgi:hypothetical protein
MSPTTLKKVAVSGVIATFTLLAACETSAPARKATAPPVSPSVRDIDGANVRPLDLGQAKAAVLLFLSTDCPISNALSPEINRVVADYNHRGVHFWIVHPDPRLSAQTAKAHAREFGYTCPVLLDDQKQLVARLGPKVTPEAIVLTPGAVAYRGRIDDTYIDLGQRRAAPTSHDLRDALDAILAGKPVPVPQTRAIGCPIE